jgi:putative endonuclease
MHYVYILLSKKDYKFYIGFTSDLKRRLQEHHNGKSQSTKSRSPLQLIYYEAHLVKGDAQRREKYFKTSKGKSTIKLMLRESLSEVITNPSVTIF